MNYTRRSFLRDSALFSAVAALGVRPSFAACAAPAAGVRVFFAGSWLFCHDPVSDPAHPTMLAVTLDPSQPPAVPPNSMDIRHTFPYGVWKEPLPGDPDAVWNSAKPSLNACALNSPYQLSIDDTTGGATKVNALFDQTNKASRFLYLTAQPQQRYTINDPGSLRVIRLPIPAAIVPAAYRTDATISDTTSVLQPSGDTTTGIATTHIFLYPNAASLTFDGTTWNTQGGFLDYHFHTVGHSDTDMPAHAPRMFQRLIGLLSPSVWLSLATSGAEIIDPGPCSLPQISNREQEVPLAAKARKPRRPGRALHPPQARRGMVISPRAKLDLATCDSGGVGVGCPPEGC